MIPKLEKKFGRIQAPSFILIFVILYAVGNLLYYVWPEALQYICFSPYLIVRKGQVWRIFTFLLYPDGSSILMILITCFIYFSIGKSLETVIGRFRLNFFLFTGWFWLFVFGFLYFFIFGGASGSPEIADVFSSTLNTYCLFSSIFALFSFIYPETRFLLLFFIPIKGKYLILVSAIFYAVDVARLLIAGNYAAMWILVFMILAAVVNLVLFLLLGGRKAKAPTSGQKEFRKQMKVVNPATSGRTNLNHKCCVCGRTSESNPELTFRYCSKCIGPYEYCNEHIYTHTHIRPKGMEDV